MDDFSAEAQYLLRFINNTNRSIFLTGKAGTGKTTLLKEIVESTHKNKVVVAPTGVAALNAKGVTIHSFFQIPPATFIPEPYDELPASGGLRLESPETLKGHLKMNKTRRTLFRELELLIIDEVSMVRADLLDAIDHVLRQVRRNQSPFGGVQMLYIGDLLQLPPVVKNEEWAILKNYYRGIFFFHARAIERSAPLFIELKKVYRQQDRQFIDILNSLRQNRISDAEVKVLNGYLRPDFEPIKHQGYITLTTHNDKADRINQQAYLSIDQPATEYHATIRGEFPDKIYPLDPTSWFKVGCQVIFIKNDLSADKRYFNGKIGVIHSLADDMIKVRFPESGEIIAVDRYEWQNIKYTIDPDTKEIKEELLGSFIHYPIKLAWAITVHKSQGLTLEKAVLDIAQVFAPGQAYVALSRLRSLEGLVLRTPIRINAVSNHADVVEYTDRSSDNASLERELTHEKQLFVMHYLIDAYSWRQLRFLMDRHLLHYAEEQTQSKKMQFRERSLALSGKLDDCLGYAERFVKQINGIYQAKNYDFSYVKERVEKAYDYFFPLMDHLVYEIFYMIGQVRRMKKMKAFYNELSELEDHFTKAVLKMHKAKVLLQLVEEGQELLSKEMISSHFTRNYRVEVASRAEKALREPLTASSKGKSDLWQAAEGEIEEPPKKKTKLPTVDVTWALWKEHHDVEKIVEARQLSISTIYGHLAKLVEQGKLELSELMSQEKIAQLQRLFDDKSLTSLSAIKQQAGRDSSWEELRLFSAYLNHKRDD